MCFYSDKMRRFISITVFYICFLSHFTFAQLCSSPNGLGKCSSNVFNCVFQNGYPYFDAANISSSECTSEEFCCVNMPLPEDGSCSQRCGVSGIGRQKAKLAETSIKLDKSYNWTLMLQGQEAQERSSRIVNGSEADKYEMCWQGGVFVVDTDQLQNNSKNTNPIYVGGAALVAQDMALTAAHVLQPFITNANFIIFIAFGFRDIRDVTDIMNGRNTTANWDEIPIFRVPNEMAFHSGYNDRTYENNIAIIRFNPISCDTANICPICLSPVPANPFQPWKGTCFASGWGATSNTSVATTLQKLEMLIPYPNECMKSFTKLGLKNYELPSTMLCADSPPSQRGGTCDRDGGSPLVCQTKYGNWELTGIVGVGINRCRQVPAPTLFTNVGYYYDWIQSYTKGTYREDGTAVTTPLSTTVTALSTTNAPTSSLRTVSPAPAPATVIPYSRPSTVSSFLSRFQFATPKVFVPKPAGVLDERQKAAQAFFMERTDDSPSVASSATHLSTTTTSTTTSQPRTFAVLLNNPSKMSGSSLSDSSGSVKFFMTAGDGLIKRKPSDALPDSRNALVTFQTFGTSSTRETTTAPTTTPTPLTTTTRTTISATTMLTSTTTQTTSVTTSATSLVVSQTPIISGITILPVKNSTSQSSQATLSANWTSSGRKVVFFIRPDTGSDGSILTLLRQRYKNSKLYTEAPTTSTELTTTSTIVTSTRNVTNASTAALKVTTTLIPLLNSTDPSQKTTQMNVTTVRVSETKAARPTGPSVML